MSGLAEWADTWQEPLFLALFLWPALSAWMCAAFGERRWFSLYLGTGEAASAVTAFVTGRGEEAGIFTAALLLVPAREALALARERRGRRAARAVPARHRKGVRA